MKERPRIVCLCGSTRFYEEYQKARYDEVMNGRIVLGPGIYQKRPEIHGKPEMLLSVQRTRALYELHLAQIELADDILVLNVNGYIGDSTRSEVAYAIEHGKPVRWLEKPDKTPLPATTGVRTKSQVAMFRCGRCGDYRVTSGLPEVGKVCECILCGHRQEFLGVNLANSYQWSWRGLPDEAKVQPEKPVTSETDWQTHSLAIAGKARCTRCGTEFRTGYDELFEGFTIACPSELCFHAVMKFAGCYYRDGKLSGWLWKDAPMPQQKKDEMLEGPLDIPTVDWTTHTTSLLQHACCRKCGKQTAVEGMVTLGQLVPCSCGHKMTFAGQHDFGAEHFWLWKDAEEQDKLKDDMSETTPSAPGWFHCPRCDRSQAVAYGTVSRSRVECRACGHVAELFGRGPSGPDYHGETQWYWRSVHPQPNKPTALYYTVRDVAEPTLRASRGHHVRIMTPHRPDWKRFALRDSANKWIAESIANPSDAGPRNYVIVKHVVNRKAPRP